MCQTLVIHMFHICNTGIYPTHVLHVQNCMYNTGVYPTHVLHMYTITCVIQVFITHNFM